MDISMASILNGIAVDLTDPIPMAASIVGGAICSEVLYTILVALIVAISARLFFPFMYSIHPLETFSVVTAFLAFFLSAQLAFRVKNVSLRSK